ncbi:hypothetical protein HK105_204694 [Polyrhizophydium stewartii]|uniref:Pentatricopeptide repeat domain-containing protein n=1 Tax=Polyrhizophydium stewartii TaxID=2732419 RepID=A0ABR4N898_9FUNG
MVPIKSMIECIRHNPDQIALLPHEAVWAMFENLRAQKATSELLRDDWHRLLCRIVHLDEPLTTHVPSGRPKQAFEMLLEMKKCGIVPDGLVNACLLRVARSSHNLLSTILQQLARDKDAFKASFHVRTAARKSQGARTSAAVAEEFPLSNKTVQTMLAIILHGHRSPTKLISMAYDLWSIVIDSPLVLTYDSYLGFLEAFALKGDRTKVSAIHKYLTVVRKQKLLQQQQRGGSFEDPWPLRVYEDLIAAHLKLGNYASARRLMNSLIECGNIPRRHTMHLHMQALDALGDHSAIVAADVLLRKHAIPFDTEICSVLLRSALAQENPAFRVQKLWERIKAQWDDQEARLNALPRDRQLDLVRDLQEINPRDSRRLLQSTAFVALLEAVSSIGTLSQVNTLFGQLVQAKTAESARKNAANNLPATSEEMIDALYLKDLWTLPRVRIQRHSCADARLVDRINAQKHALQHIRAFIPPLPSRAAVAALISHLSARRDSAAIRRLFEQHALAPSRMIILWGRKLAFSAKKLHDLAGESIARINLLEQELANEKSRLRGPDPQSDQPQESKPERESPEAGLHMIAYRRELFDLRRTVSWAAREIKKGVQLQTGKDGPLKILYEALDHSWREAAEGSRRPPPDCNKAFPPTEEEQSQMLIELERMLTDFEQRERSVALSLNLPGLATRSLRRSVRARTKAGTAQNDAENGDDGSDEAKVGDLAGSNKKTSPRRGSRSFESFWGTDQ